MTDLTTVGIFFFMKWYPQPVIQHFSQIRELIQLHSSGKCVSEYKYLSTSSGLSLYNASEESSSLYRFPLCVVIVTSVLQPKRVTVTLKEPWTCSWQYSISKNSACLLILFFHSLHLSVKWRKCRGPRGWQESNTVKDRSKDLHKEGIYPAKRF